MGCCCGQRSLHPSDSAHQQRGCIEPTKWALTNDLVFLVTFFRASLLWNIDMSYVEMILNRFLQHTPGHWLVPFSRAWAWRCASMGKALRAPSAEALQHRASLFIHVYPSSINGQCQHILTTMGCLANYDKHIVKNQTQYSYRYGINHMDSYGMTLCITTLCNCPRSSWFQGCGINAILSNEGSHQIPATWIDFFCRNGVLFLSFCSWLRVPRCKASLPIAILAVGGDHCWQGLTPNFTMLPHYWQSWGQSLIMFNCLISLVSHFMRQLGISRHSEMRLL